MIAIFLIENIKTTMMFPTTIKIKKAAFDSIYKFTIIKTTSPKHIPEIRIFKRNKTKDFIVVFGLIIGFFSTYSFAMFWLNLSSKITLRI